MSISLSSSALPLTFLFFLVPYRTEILVQIDNRVARRTKPNLVGKLSPYGQDLLAGRVETKEKLAEAEEERVSEDLPFSSLISLPTDLRSPLAPSDIPLH